MEWDDGTIDWDAAFDALVAPLRPPRYLRVFRAACHAGALLALMTVMCWTVVRLVGDPLRELGRPWF